MLRGLRTEPLLLSCWLTVVTSYHRARTSGPISRKVATRYCSGNIRRCLWPVSLQWSSQQLQEQSADTPDCRREARKMGSKKKKWYKVVKASGLNTFINPQTPSGLDRTMWWTSSRIGVSTHRLNLWTRKSKASGQYFAGIRPPVLYVPHFGDIWLGGALLLIHSLSPMRRKSS